MKSYDDLLAAVGVWADTNRDMPRASSVADDAASWTAIAGKHATAARYAARAYANTQDHPLDTPEEWDALYALEPASEAALRRDLVGNPFRPLPRISASVLAWNDRCVVKLATSIYDERAFDRMPILGDALEDARLKDEEMLKHCRQGGAAHARGC